MANRPAWRDLPRNVWVLSLTSLLRDVASEMLVHLVPLFMANVLGTRTVVIGLVEGLAETTASLVKVASGWLSDRWRRRKALTVAGYGLAAAATPLLLVAGSWLAVLAYRVLDRLGKGIRTAPRDALIAESVPPERRGLGFGLHRAADSAGLMAWFCHGWCPPQPGRAPGSHSSGAVLWSGAPPGVCCWPRCARVCCAPGARLPEPGVKSWARLLRFQVVVVVLGNPGAFWCGVSRRRRRPGWACGGLKPGLTCARPRAYSGLGGPGSWSWGWLYSSVYLAWDAGSCGTSGALSLYGSTTQDRGLKPCGDSETGVARHGYGIFRRVGYRLPQVWGGVGGGWRLGGFGLALPSFGGAMASWVVLWFWCRRRGAVT